jgi:hypothetical protein
MILLLKHRESIRSSDKFAASVLEVGGWSAPRPGHFTTGNDPVFIVVHEAGWAAVVKSIVNSRIRRVQPVVSRCTDCAIPATSFLVPYEFTLPKAAN